MYYAQRTPQPAPDTGGGRHLGFAYSETASVAASQYRQRIQNVSLTHLRIQQFLHLNDHHIPLPIIRLYYEELQRDPAAQNKEAIMAYTMLLRDWHMTRNKLNFIRDVTKVALLLGKRLSDNLMVVEAALNNLEVTPQDVYESIMSDILEQAERRGLSVGEYLIQKYNEAQSGVSEQPGREVSSLQALFPNANVTRRRTFWNSFTVTFLLRLCKETLRTVTKLDGKGGDYFQNSEPTWSRRDGTPYMRTSREIAEDAQLRRKLMEKLLSAPSPGDVESGESDSDPQQPVVAVEASESGGRLRTTTPSPPATAGGGRDDTENGDRVGGGGGGDDAEEDDDTYTVDTSTFRECYRQQEQQTAVGSVGGTHPEKRARVDVLEVQQPRREEEEEERCVNEMECNAERIERALSELNAKPARGVLKDDMFGDEDDGLEFEQEGGGFGDGDEEDAEVSYAANPPPQPSVGHTLDFAGSSSQRVGTIAEEDEEDDAALSEADDAEAEDEEDVY